MIDDDRGGGDVGSNISDDNGFINNTINIESNNDCNNSNSNDDCNDGLYG